MASKASATPAGNPLDAAMDLVARRRTADPLPAPATPLAPIVEPTAQAAPAPVGLPTDNEPADVEPTDNQQQKGKKDQAPAAPSAGTDYASLFLKTVKGRKPKTIYLSEDMHQALAIITQASPDNIGLSDLLINIIQHHFETFGPGIRQFLTTQEKLRKNKLPY